MKRLLPLIVLTLASCSKSDSKSDPAPTATATPTSTATPSTALTWDTDIKSIVAARCGTTSCHASGSTQVAYVGSESLFKAGKTGILSRVVTLANMPPTDASAAQKAITSDERTKIKTFLNQ